jgi:LPXTG-motif cell wall-anchored protein
MLVPMIIAAGIGLALVGFVFYCVRKKRKSEVEYVEK